MSFGHASCSRIRPQANRRTRQHRRPASSSWLALSRPTVDTARMSKGARRTVPCGPMTGAAAACFDAMSELYHRRAWDWCFLAMTHHRLAHAQEARRCLAEAARWIDDANRADLDDIVGNSPAWGDWAGARPNTCCKRRSRGTRRVSRSGVGRAGSARLPTRRSLRRAAGVSRLVRGALSRVARRCQPQKNLGILARMRARLRLVQRRRGLGPRNETNAHPNSGPAKLCQERHHAQPAPQITVVLQWNSAAATQPDHCIAGSSFRVGRACAGERRKHHQRPHGIHQFGDHFVWTSEPFLLWNDQRWRV